MTHFATLGTRFLPAGVLVLVVCAWFWPVTVLGRRLASEQITTKYIPLMAYYGRAIQQGRLPLWNESWGFGVPQLAESQTGVFYPIHLALYGLFDVTTAYTLSALAHFLLGGSFGYWCARGFGLSAVASLFAAVVFIGQGFFIVLIDRPWSYTSGCWLPLAVLAAWRWARDGRWHWLFGLAVALAVQLLAGHFQIACLTAIVVVGVACGAAVMGCGPRLAALGRVLLAPIAWVVAVALAAVQLVPSAELAVRWDPRGRAVSSRAEMGNHPGFLVNYLAPTLLRHPLWEPIAWAPANASPRECLNYVGLGPVMLAGIAVVAGRRERLVRLWTILLAVCLAFSFGSYLPCLKWLFARCDPGWLAGSSRWNIVTGLFLGMLAGWSIDHLDPSVARRWCLRFAGGALVLLGVAAGGIVACASGGFGDRWSASFKQAHTADIDSPVGQRLLDRGYRLGQRVSAADDLKKMLVAELSLPVCNLGLFALIGLAAGRVLSSRPRLAAAFLSWTALELGLFAAVLRPIQFGQNAPWAKLSPVLDQLSRSAGQRVVGKVGELPAVAGAAPVGLMPAGLPRMGDWAAQLQRDSLWVTGDHVEFLRLCDIRVLLRPPFSRHHADVAALQMSVVSDPWLSALVRGPGAAKLPGSAQWGVLDLDPRVETGRAWTFPVSQPPAPGTDPRRLRGMPPARMGLLDRATPAERVTARGERVDVIGTTDSPAVVVLSDLDFPGWEAEVLQGGTWRRVPIQPAFGGLRAVHLSEAGPYQILFTYRPASFRLGCKISLSAVVVCVLACVVMALRRTV